MAERVALVRQPSSRMAEGITTHIDRVPADAAVAVAQHEAYVAAIAATGRTICEVPPADALPDSAFVEDTVAVFDDLAVLARPGAVERRPEVAGTGEVVRSLGSRWLGSRTQARSTVETSSRSGAPRTWAEAGGPTPRASASSAATRRRGAASSSRYGCAACFTSSRR